MLRGLHHVTAIAGDPQANLRFYTEFLGLRLVKKTVNFDDPGTYHLYYGDSGGTPGTLITFFAWPGSPRARKGSGQPTEIALTIGRDSLSYWKARCLQHGVPFTPLVRFGDETLEIEDPDGITLHLVAAGDAPGVSRIRSVTLAELDPLHASRFLTDTLGMLVLSEEHDRTRLAFEDGCFLDLLHSTANRGSAGSGVIHHVALRCDDESSLAAWRDRVIAAGMKATIILDRRYFHSTYFRERDAKGVGGVLFEIATTGPGFTVDEPLEHLGETLALPPWLEPSRESIERRLPKL
ncbi:MAG: VOC family protein [Bryobacteraceae bacterium]